MRLANELKICGEVKNSGGNVTIIAQGKKEALDEYIQRLDTMFNITQSQIEEIEGKGYKKFSIVHSTNDNDIPFITPDLATCRDCEAELKDKNNRRFAHPFISCVNCGPRYTIIKSLPYDRERITMSEFGLCSQCTAEYTNADDRRCHAQTIACKSCGPTTNITIEKAVDILSNKKILAIKDIGGYHLACVCETEPALRLREIKGREKKPFAVMFKDIEQVKQYCKVNASEEDALLSSARPIVLLERLKPMPHGICDDSDYIGAFLPCNPIQIMILNQISPLVMTSANISGEPIITDDNEIKKFGVDVLSHNREILTPLDDSVVQINSSRFQTIRRARGYVPLAIDIGKSAKDTLCLGGDLKSSFCIVHNGYAYPSQYFGDLEDVKCLDEYKRNIKRFCSLHSFKPEKTVCDRHPMYHSSNIYHVDKKYQHHLAHAYSVVAENSLCQGEDVLHFVFDGTGYGDDGAIWGGEVFYNTKRVEHLEYVKMPAGDEIAKNADLALACYDGSNELINRAIVENINVINTSSMGRLFDAVCACLDIKHRNSYEGECAMALEACAKRAKKAYYIEPTLDPRKIINAVKNAKAPKEEVALGFHYMLCQLILDISKKYDADMVTLSGGCFVNRILLSRAQELLESNGIMVFTNRQVSCGDNGICLGQAYLSAMEE